VGRTQDEHNVVPCWQTDNTNSGGQLVVYPASQWQTQANSSTLSANESKHNEADTVQA